MTVRSRQIDVRAPRAAAWVTSAVLIAVLLGSGVPLGIQALVFATGLALVLATPLHAAVGSCPGCASHLLVRRAVPART